MYKLKKNNRRDDMKKMLLSLGASELAADCLIYLEKILMDAENVEFVLKEENSYTYTISLRRDDKHKVGYRYGGAGWKECSWAFTPTQEFQNGFLMCPSDTNAALEELICKFGSGEIKNFVYIETNTWYKPAPISFGKPFTIPQFSTLEEFKMKMQIRGK